MFANISTNYISTQNQRKCTLAWNTVDVKLERLYASNWVLYYIMDGRKRHVAIFFMINLPLVSSSV